MWTRFLTLSSFVALLSAVSAQQQYAGDLTAYTMDSPDLGNCNFMTTSPDAARNYAAINTAQWDAAQNCGRCAQVTCADSRCKDTTTAQIVYILDQCPTCKEGGLDVSPSAFKAMTGSDPDLYKIKWSFVDCPVTGNLNYCLNSGSNPYWVALQPANSAATIKSMTINSKTTTVMPSSYYYVLDSQVDFNAVHVSVTSTSGETVTETVSLTAGQCTTGTSQFKAGGNASASPVGPSPSTPSTPAPTTKAPSAPVSPPTPTTTAAPASTSAPSPTPTTAPAPSTNVSTEPPTPSPTKKALCVLRH